ncbi:hypothetical protein CRG98_032204, partial [Punica granatum]
MELTSKGNHQAAAEKLAGADELLPNMETGAKNCNGPADVSDRGSQEDGFSEVVVGQEMDNRDDRREEETVAVGVPKAAGEQQQRITVMQPHSLLPKPEAPRGFFTAPQPDDDAAMNRSQSLTDSLAVDMPAIGKYIRDRSNSFSAAIVRRLSSLKDGSGDEYEPDSKPDVTEINLSGLKVIVKLKTEPEKELKGRISFFSKSGCRDCRAVRSFFRERGLRFVEINVDVYPLREKELVARTGSSAVPAIFFNEKLLGGLVALNSLRNCGLLERRMEEMLGGKCPPEAPAVPVYGFDDPEEEAKDGAVAVVRVLRQRLPIQDRLMKMKIVKNCFAGAEMVEALIHHFDCGRKKSWLAGNSQARVRCMGLQLLVLQGAVTLSTYGPVLRPTGSPVSMAIEIGRQLAKKHFIHHVFGENDFEDGNHFYRFLEHEPFIPRCFNFRGSTNDNEPKSAALIGLKITKIMTAILESYASDNRQHLDYAAISKSEEFR